MRTGDRHTATGNRRKKLFGSAFCAVLFALGLPCSPPLAGQAESFARIGTLGAAGGSNNPSRRWNSFRQGLRELGYVDGKNIVIEARSARGETNRLAELGKELVRLKVAVIVTGGASATQGATRATKTVPIVMAQDSDPVGSGFVATLARPGGNITGLSSQSSEMNGKRLELLKEIVPRVSRVAIFGNSANPGNALALKHTELAAAAFGIKLQYRDLQKMEDIKDAFRTATNNVDAVLWLNNPVLLTRKEEIANLVMKSRLPAMYDSVDYVEAGGIMSYGRDVSDLFSRAAVYVDKIFKGAKPADLPVEQPTKFEFVINLKTAKQIGLPIPANVLARADQVIK